MLDVDDTCAATNETVQDRFIHLTKKPNNFPAGFDTKISFGERYLVLALTHLLGQMT